MKKIIISLAVIALLIGIPGHAFAGRPSDNLNNLIPNMTSNNQPSGVVSASSFMTCCGGRQYLPWYTFSNDPGWWWASGYNISTAWLQYEFPAAKVVNSYYIHGETSYGPQTWRFEGSNDGTNWTVFHTYNQGADDPKAFKFVNNNAYKFYRINITQHMRDHSGVFRLEMYHIPDDITPSGLVLTPDGEKIRLFWNHVMAGLKGYNVYVNGSKINSEPIKVNQFVFEDVFPGQHYGFQVTAVDVVGNESNKTPTVYYPSEPPKILPAPSGLTAQPVDQGVMLTWNPTDPEPDKYAIYRNGVKIAETTETSFLDETVQKGEFYRYEVSAVFGDDESVRTVSEIQYNGPPLPVPSGLVAKQTTDGILLTWNPTDPEPDKYVIYRNGVKIAETTETSFLDETASKDTGYWYEVSALFGEDESGRAETYIFYSSVPALDFGGWSLPFSIPDMLHTAVEFLKKYGLWILLALGVIFADVLTSPPKQAVNQARKKTRTKIKDQPNPDKAKAAKPETVKPEKGAAIKVDSKRATGEKATKLIPKQVVYQRGGKSYTRKVYVKPENYKVGQVIRIDKEKSGQATKQSSVVRLDKGRR